MEGFRQFMEQFGTEAAAPSARLRIHTEQVASQPDRNTINLQVIRPGNDETLPFAYYIHPGGMGYLSCFDGMFWGGTHRRERRDRPYRSRTARTHHGSPGQSRHQARTAQSAASVRRPLQGAGPVRRRSRAGFAHSGAAALSRRKTGTWVLSSARMQASGHCDGRSEGWELGCDAFCGKGRVA
jgi:hypothetical protein